MPELIRQLRGAFPGTVEPDATIRAQLALLGKNPVRYGPSKPFPQVTLLDAFTRANANTLGSDWTADPLNYGAQMPHIASNALTRANNTDYNDSWWNAATFGPDTDIVLTIGTPAVSITDNVQHYIYARLSVPGTAGVDGYYCYINKYEGDPAFMDIFEVTDTVSTELTTQTTVPDPVTGDKLGFRLRGSTLEGWFYHGGTWALYLRVTNTAHASAGYVGISLFDTQGGASIDDFSAGTL